jgi:integrase/recombinase XerD
MFLLLHEREENDVARPRGIQVEGVLGPFKDGVQEALKAGGYSSGSIDSLLLLTAHASRWLDARGIGVGELTDEVVEQFFADFRTCHSWCRSSRSFAMVLAHLRAVGAAPSATIARAHGIEGELLDGFRRYLVEQRGLAQATADVYAKRAEACIRSWWPGGEIAVETLVAADVVAVVRSCAEVMAPPTLRSLVTALRSLLRYFHTQGMTSRSLVGAVPPMAAWPRSALPSTFTTSDAARLVASCDLNTVAGRRDAAVLRIFARLGLRRGEVIGLTLDDIDWRAGELRVTGKGGRVDLMPLPPDVGEALAFYLSSKRPVSSRSGRAVFLTAGAPFGPMGKSAASWIVHRACDRAGVTSVGPHRLRHMVATETLRSGAPLSEVAQLLRHAAVSTSAIYAIPGPDSVAALARPWPEVDR